MVYKKYDWGLIIKDYENGLQTKDICEKYNLPSGTLYQKIYKLKIKRPHGFIIKPNIVLSYKSNELKSLIDKKISYNIIAEKLNITPNSISRKASKLKLKSKHNKQIKNMFFSQKEADEIRNKYYLGIWVGKTQTELANFLKCSKVLIGQLLAYKRYTSHLNLTPEQITALHQEMKAKRKQLREDLENV
jgi:hypothetical protein